MPFTLIVRDRSGSWAGRLLVSSVHSTREEAHAALAEYVRRNWDAEIGEDRPADGPEMIARYFGIIPEVCEIREIDSLWQCCTAHELDAYQLRLRDVIRTAQDYLDEEALCAGLLFKYSEGLPVSPNVFVPLKHTFTLPETVVLVKAVTIISYTYWGGSGGSVDPLIWLLQHARDLYREQRAPGLEDLVDWVLSRTDNTYLPWGTFDSRSRWEAQKRRAWIESSNDPRAVEIRAREARAHAEWLAKAPEREAKAEAERQREREAEALARTAEEAKAEYLRLKSENPPKLHEFSVSCTRCLELIAFDLKHCLAFFPKDWARTTSEDLAKLDERCRVALMKRLENSNSVSWSRLYGRLLERGGADTR